jgi:hypothetical protein
MKYCKAMGLATILCTALWGCARQVDEPPTSVGRLLVGDEMKLITRGRALASQRVAIEGHMVFCSLNGRYRQGNVVDAEIRATPTCRGRPLAGAKVLLLARDAAEPGLLASGPRPRNAVLIGDIFSNDHVSYLTDDYQVVAPRSLVRVSGVVHYASDGEDEPVLEAVALHAAMPASSGEVAPQ